MPVMTKIESWKTFEGRMVDGKFPLRQWIGGSDHSAVFATESLSHAGQKLAIKLIAVEAAGAERQLTALREAAKLSHPHLIRLFDTGRVQLDGSSFVYAVMEFAEEDLSQILPQRPLEPSEVSDLLPPLLDALSYLHAKRLVHSRIKPSNILAAGDKLKLSSDSITASSSAESSGTRRDVYDAPETGSGIVTPEGDLWSIGVVVVEALTQDAEVAEQATGKPGLPQSIAEPFRGIARECLQTDPKRRCSPAQIQARLQPPARTVPAPPEPPLPPRTSKNRWSIYSVALAIVVVILLAYTFLHSRGKKPSAPETAVVPTGETPAPPPATKPAEAPRPKLPSSGEVAREVMPDIPKSALNTVHGTIKVMVQVQADASGKVTSSKFRMRGSSPYFYERALRAAQQWEFSPPVVDGQPASSTWLILFRFKRGSMQASAQRLKH